MYSQPDVAEEVGRCLQQLLAKERGEVLLHRVVQFHRGRAERDVRELAVRSPFLAVWQ